MIQPTFVAEIGCNHMGSMSVASEMIKIAANLCKVDVVKFQKRNNRELLTAEEFSRPHPVTDNAYGATYGEHREFLEFSIEQHQQLKRECEEAGVTYASSVWDCVSAEEVISLAPTLIKVPSACNLNFELLDLLAINYDGEIHLSLGMTDRQEEAEIMDFFTQLRITDRLVLYGCTSAYPAPFEDLYLREITRIRRQYKDQIGATGFSGHHLGIAADVAALALGAKWFERHFTLSRSWKGTDHAASLEPDDFSQLVKDLKNVSKSLAYKPESTIVVEQEQRLKLKRIKRPHAQF